MQTTEEVTAILQKDVHITTAVLQRGEATETAKAEASDLREITLRHSGTRRHLPYQRKAFSGLEIMRLLWMRCLAALHQRQIKWS